MHPMALAWGEDCQNRRLCMPHACLWALPPPTTTPLDTSPRVLYGLHLAQVSPGLDAGEPGTLNPEGNKEVLPPGCPQTPPKLGHMTYL